MKPCRAGTPTATSCSTGCYRPGGNSISGPRLSVLDTVPLGPGATATDALADTVRVGRTAQEHGYHRIWIAEHHAAPDNACSQPALVIAGVAAATERIRVGAGGVMLANHRPLAVAEQFHTLRAMFGDRIDLGLGRAGGAGDLALHALGRRIGADSLAGFADDIAELDGFLTGDWPAEAPYRSIRPSPSGPPPPRFLLGSSPGSADLAGRLGWPFVFARHLAPGATEASVRQYRDSFQAAGHQHRPYLVLACGVAAAETDAQARAAARTAGLVRLRAFFARRAGTVATPAQLTDPRCTDAEAGQVQAMLDDSAFLVGDGAWTAAALGELAADTGADELMLTSLHFDVADRVATLTSIARAMAPPARSAVSR